MQIILWHQFPWFHSPSPPVQQKLISFNLINQCYNDHTRSFSFSLSETVPGILFGKYTLKHQLSAFFVSHVQVDLRDRATKAEYLMTHSSIYSFITRNIRGYSMKK